jgi:hypothetical protein
MNSINLEIITTNTINKDSESCALVEQPARIPMRLLNFKSPRKQQTMSMGYQPTSFDVCCGRGKQHWTHSGNVNFRKFIQNNIHLYQEAQTKPAKTALVVTLVEHVRSNGGHFLKLEEDSSSADFGCWVDIGDFLARDKVSHSLRDQINHQARRKCKLARKQQRQSNFEQRLLEAQEMVSVERLRKVSFMAIQCDSVPQYVDIPASLRCSEESCDSSSDFSIIQALIPVLESSTPTTLAHSVTHYDYPHEHESSLKSIHDAQEETECYSLGSYDYLGFGAFVPTDGNQTAVVFDV